MTLNQDEIHTAVETYVRSQINIASNQELTIDFTAGRGPNGISATLDIKAAAPKPKMVAITRTVNEEAGTTTYEPKASITETPEDRQDPELADGGVPQTEAETTPVEGEASEPETSSGEAEAPAEDQTSAPRQSIFSKRPAA